MRIFGFCAGRPLEKTASVPRLPARPRGPQEARDTELISDEVIAEVRERTDIVALIGEYVSLRKRGANHVGLCPFHNEKTPSFNVRADRQFFHCFGCKESGDAFAFLMRLDGVSFPSAARQLADRAGIEVRELEGEQGAAQRREQVRREKLHGLMDAAARYYREQLTAHALAPVAQAELSERGVAHETAEAYGLGYSPHGWDGLGGWLREHGWSLADAEVLGLLARRRSGSGYYDRFRHRLMFPITDLSGRVVAFSGRALPPPAEQPDQEPGPKYVNSPEGPLYTKGQVLFGLHRARVEIRRLGWAVLCEGNFDVLALHQAGLRNVVAPLGTAFTEGHAKLLRRFAERVTLMFDGDGAGLKAVAAAYPLRQRAGLTCRVARLPNGEDPDSYLRAHGADALRALVDRSPGVVEHLIDSAADHAGADAASRANAIERLGPTLASVGNPVEIELYIERVAQRFAMRDLGAVKAQLRRGVRATRQGPQNREKSALAHSSQRVKLPKLQTELLGALLDKPELFATSHADNLQGLLTDPSLRAVYDATADLVRKDGVLDASRLLSSVEGNLAEPWLKERLAVEAYTTKAEAEDVLRSGVPLLAKRNIESELPALARQIGEARRDGDDERAVMLTKQRDDLALTAHSLINGPER